MRKLMLLLAGALMAVAITACTPTQRPAETEAVKTETEAHDHDHAEDEMRAPDGTLLETKADGTVEKQLKVADDDPAIMVCVYSVNKDNTGLKQNMDAVDGEELDPQALMDKMAELEVVEEGIEVVSFEYKNGVITMDLSGLEALSDELVVTAIANTFLQNYEAEELNLSVAGGKVGDGPMTFLKEYKKIK